MAIENEEVKKPKKKIPTKKLRLRVAWKILLLIFLIGTVIGLCGIIGVNEYFEKSTGTTVEQCIQDAKDAIKDSTPEDFRSAKASQIYSEDGKNIATLYENKENSYLTYDDIPPNVVNAFVAVEDRTYWTNSGVDLKGMIRVGLDYVVSRGQTMNGASTITQQLARGEYLTRDKTLSRKLKEIFVARDLTEKYSKEEIMEFYVNTCCFANAIYGIQDASLTYFGKEVSELTLSETAYLCSIPNRPEYYNPLKNPDNAITRRDKILKDMLTCGYISEHQYEEAVDEKMEIYEDTTEEEFNYETTYAINCATKYLMELSGFEFEYKWDSDADYKEYQTLYNEAYQESKHELYVGGYSVYTSIDTEKQTKMQAILDEQLAEEDEVLENGIYKIQGAMTVIDNESGKVVAIIGGRSQEETKGIFTLNRGFQGYAQPGSTIKPLVAYAPSMEQTEFHPNTYLTNVDVREAKKSTNSEIIEMEGSQVLLRNAAEQSLNGCAYWLFSSIGINSGLSKLVDMEFAKIAPSDYNIGTCLGGITYGTTTEEMANAYSTLENSGLYRDANCLVSILDKDGTELYQEDEAVRVYDREAADAMTDVMKGVLTRGTAYKSKWYSNTDTEAAGKTGTTNDNKAAWFCGYTPYYSIAVWVGCDTPTEIPGLMGSTYPLSIWKNAMLNLIDGLPTAELADLPDSKDIKPIECTCELCCEAERNENGVIFPAHINMTCPLCSKAGDKFADVCKGEKLVCTCGLKCSGDAVNELCPVCLHDPTRCLGVEGPCICTDKCVEGLVNPNCPVCMRDFTICAGVEAVPEEPTPNPEDPNMPQPPTPDPGPDTTEPVVPPITPDPGPDTTEPTPVVPTPDPVVPPEPTPDPVPDTTVPDTTEHPKDDTTSDNTVSGT